MKFASAFTDVIVIGDWGSGPVAAEASNTWDATSGGNYSGGDARMTRETGNGGGVGGDSACRKYVTKS